MAFSPYNRPPRRPFDCGPSLTDQSFKDECDVNNIVKRFKQTGLLPRVEAEGFFEDVTLIPEDLMAAKARIRETERAFYMLPSELREKFGNSYISLLQFLEDPANREEAISLGLFAKKAAPPEPGAPDSGTPSP